MYKLIYTKISVNVRVLMYTGARIYIYIQVFVLVHTQTYKTKKMCIQKNGVYIRGHVHGHKSVYAYTRSRAYVHTPGDTHMRARINVTMHTCLHRYIHTCLNSGR